MRKITSRLYSIRVGQSRMLLEALRHILIFFLK